MNQSSSDKTCMHDNVKTIQATSRVYAYGRNRNWLAKPIQYMPQAHSISSLNQLGLALCRGSGVGMHMEWGCPVLLQGMCTRQAWCNAFTRSRFAEMTYIHVYFLFYLSLSPSFNQEIGNPTVTSGLQQHRYKCFIQGVSHCEPSWFWFDTNCFVDYFLFQNDWQNIK